MNILILFPLSVTILIPITIFLTYLLAVNDNTVKPLLPYVSDCAFRAPEASIFTELVTIIAILIFCTIVLRVIQVKTILDTDSYCRLLSISATGKQRILFVNCLSLYMAPVLSLGLISLASFRVIETSRIHFASAAVIFSVGPVFFGTQTWISYQLSPLINSQWMAYFRLSITLVSVVSIVSSSGFTLWSFQEFRLKFRSSDRLVWTSADGGYWQHVLAALFEWLYLLSVGPFVATFVGEVNQLKLTSGPTFEYVIHTD
ncbi:DNA damage-regulated autophagy modulator protein 1-like [Oppia nitens]|uniref:DNA damage-regulated autophagy modulator protein 1-like n=1 Tax=Oppia nitens TaxID=1686743 RepID=UPI0023DA1139|nr:DNA damage-regulated autophagy modulator protein 1-like [Oppia nitens]